MSNKSRIRIELDGIVQGVGFRPFVWQLANSLNLAGWVCNHDSGVTVEVEGDPKTTNAFTENLRLELPPLARIDALECVDLQPLNETKFIIRESNGFGRANTLISPDVSICDECRQELFDIGNRRYQYPFITCTNCGPRFTIVEEMPFDRRNTTMKAFEMCDECTEEYNDPFDRRFHSQTNACFKCGPKVWYVDAMLDDSQIVFPPEHGVDIVDTIKSSKDAIAKGKIIAVKGVGGFHLVCDATNFAAVETLRVRKGRIEKPFALMARDAMQAATFATVSIHEQRLLESRERPIVLLNKRKDSNLIAPNVSSGNEFVGVMLPYTPLHYLLLDDAPLLMTSGNRTEEPIVRTNTEATKKLAKIADGFLFHNREINIVCDDSVVRCVAGEVLPIRRSRGYAPIPITLCQDGPSILAVGGELKSTFCVTKKRHAFMSQHLGDMENIETIQAMQQNVARFLDLFRIEPNAIASDMHPGYLSGQCAQTFAKELNVPLVHVQHHFAHVVSLIIEHGLDSEEKIIGCCFDGTGYGTDGTIWGGEFLVANTFAFDRFAALEQFPLPGGDISIKRPSHSALSLLWSNDIQWQEKFASVQAVTPQERKILFHQLEKNLNCAPTSSMGRLFDAVASLINVRHQISYEAQAAMELEAMANQAMDSSDDSYSFELCGTELLRMKPTRLLRAICDDLENGLAPQQVAAKFHRAVAIMISEVCKLARAATGIDIVGLTGGVFQNALLLELAKKMLLNDGFQVLTHRLVPANDGGISLGQAIVGRNRLMV